jgi:hypothetical protein
MSGSVAADVYRSRGPDLRLAPVGFTWPSRMSCAGPCRLRSVPVCAPRCVRSGSLDFPAPSPTFTVSGGVLEVFRRSAPPSLSPAGRDSSLAFVPVRRPGQARIGLSRGERVDDRSASPGLPPPPPTCPAGSTPAARPLGRSASATEGPPPPSRSVRVVSHDLDGFLHLQGRGLVASRCQSWGSPRFLRRPTRSGSGEGSVCVSVAACLAARSPLEGAPSIPAVPRHRGLVPPWCCADDRSPTVTFEALLRNPGL